MGNSYPSNDHYPWYIRLIFFLQCKHYGAVLNSAKVWARSPRVFLALSFLFGALDRKKSPISATTRSLIIIRVSQLNGCSFCVDLNTAVLLKRGIDMAKVLELSKWEKSGAFTLNEKTVLEYAEALTLRKTISKPLKQKISQFYSHEELVEITGLIAFQNMSTLFNNAFDIEPQGFCHLSES